MAGLSFKDFFAAFNTPANGVTTMRGKGDTVVVNGQSFTWPKTAEQPEAPVPDPALKQDLPSQTPKHDLSSVAERMGIEAGQMPGANVVKEASAPVSYEEIEEDFIPDPIARHYKRRDQRRAERAARKFSYDMRFANRRKRFNEALMADLEGRDLTNPKERAYMYNKWGATLDDQGNINIEEIPSPDVLKEIRR